MTTSEFKVDTAVTDGTYFGVVVQRTECTGGKANLRWRKWVNTTAATHVYELMADSGFRLATEAEMVEHIPPYCVGAEERTWRDALKIREGVPIRFAEDVTKDTKDNLERSRKGGG